jgi:hypothetical protein
MTKIFTREAERESRPSQKAKEAKIVEIDHQVIVTRKVEDSAIRS